MLLHQAWGGGRAEQQAGYPPGGPSPPRDDHVGVAENQLAALRLEEYPFLTGNVRALGDQTRVSQEGW